MANRVLNKICDTFALNKADVKDYAFAAVGVFVITALSLGQLLAKNFKYETSESMRTAVDVLGGGYSQALISTLFVICILAPIVEELIFRGALWNFVSKILNVNYAFVVITILFAMAHKDPAHIAGVFPLSVWLAFVRYRSNSILPCIFAHALNNVIISICIIAS